ncbi:MAG: tRNA 5-methoxyuridine(34)/uridine 5-oxyacetic acid(34) synthase CmoB [Pseudomonadales bacterium]
MIQYDDFYTDIIDTRLERFADDFKQVLNTRYFDRIHGDHPLWRAALDALPELAATNPQLNSDTVSADAPENISDAEQQQLRDALMGLHPWRKGPFKLCNVFVDTEWRSDWKWNRVVPHIQPLTYRNVLDVGCGNGYHCWRMRGAGANLVVGIDPSQKFLYQFHAVKKYLGQHPVHLLPLRSEDMPANMQAFDSVFSMGVLYHRKSPFDHLEELKAALRPGGELVLETLVIEGTAGQILVPGDRYAQMRNVWFLPSVDELTHWLERVGFTDVHAVDISRTTAQEQRATDWMKFHSLVDFLDPDDDSKTLEGYPAPLRATMVATKR